MGRRGKEKRGGQGEGVTERHHTEHKVSKHYFVHIILGNQSTVPKDVKMWNRKPVLKAKGKLKTVEENSAAIPQRGR